MLVVDVNLLLYAVNQAAPDHRAALSWWQETLSGEEPVGLAWMVVLAFLRISTNPRILPAPLPYEAADQLVDEWLAQPVVRVVQPTDRHWGILRSLLKPYGTAGNLSADAHLAALAIEHGATLCSTDGDFARFPHLKWRNPIRQPA